MTKAAIRTASIGLLAVAASLLGMPAAQAQNGIVWEQTKGPTGGQINVLLIDEQNPSIVYAGTAGGVFTSRDRGSTWRDSSQGPPSTSQVWALALASRPTKVLYAGTESGIYRSTDSGHSWEPITTGLTRTLVLSLAVDPTDNRVIYAGTGERVFKSIDGGEQWKESSKGLSEKIWALAVDYAIPDVVYAGTDSGVFKSTDGGQSWRRAGDGMPEGLLVQMLVLDRHLRGTIYAATEAGVYRSTDYAVTWKAVIEGIGPNRIYALAIDPNVSGTLYAAAEGGGIWRSTNEGKTWNLTGGLPESARALAVHPTRSQIIFAGTWRGVYISNNTGQTWEPRNEGLINADVLLLTAALGHLENLYACTALDVHKTSDYGQSWVPINKGLVHPNTPTLAIDPEVPDTLYIGTWASEIYKSVDGGRNWSSIAGLARDVPIMSLLVHRIQARPDLPDGVIYAGTNGAGVFTSTDGGSTWATVNEGLENLEVQALALARVGEGILYAGTRNGIYRLDLASESEMGGLRWQPPQQGMPQGEVKGIVVDDRSPHILYAATAKGKLHRSTDGGETWAAIGEGSLLTTTEIRALAINTSCRGKTILYAGTNGGVLRSEDGGASWQGINRNLPPDASISALFFDASHSYLYAGVSNKGVYKALDKEKRVALWPRIAAALSAMLILLVGVLFAVRWLRRSSQQAQEQTFARNWPLWREEIQRLLQSENEVRAEALAFIPAALRVRALQQYVQEREDDNFVLRLTPPLLEPANSLQVWDFLRNWRAAQKRLGSPAAFRPVALRITEQLCQLLGFTLFDGRSYKKLHGFMVKAHALRLKVPPMFPIIFMPKPDLTEEDISDVRDMMGILNVTSYLALLIIPDNGAAAGRGQELKTRFRRRAGGAADDFIVLDFDDLYRIFVARDPERRFVSILLSQVDLTVVSPYVTSGPVPENMFFGRDQELKTVTRTIKDNNFAIVGGRKIGKTSILTKLNRLFKDSTEYYPLYLDCQAVQDYRDFCDAIETVWKLPLSEYTPEAFMRLIARMQQERAGQLVVILLDEVDALLKHDTANQERLFKVFRALSQEGHCRFIFCGERVLNASLHDPSSAFFNFCNIIRLSYLTPRDAGRIILEPLQEMGIGLEDASGLVQEIIDFSSCHPNLVQYICQELIALINRRGDRFITLADLEAVGNSTQFNEYLIEVVWGNATPLERLITLLMLDKPGVTLAQIAEALRAHGVQVSLTTIEQALDALVLSSVLSKEDQEYRFMATAFPSAMAATQDVASLVERMVQQVRSADS